MRLNINRLIHLILGTHKYFEPANSRKNAPKLDLPNRSLGGCHRQRPYNDGNSHNDRRKRSQNA